MNVRTIPFTAYVVPMGNSSMGRIIKLRDRLAVYTSVTAALRDEHLVTNYCRDKNRSVQLVTCTSVESLVSFNENGRISGRKKADTVAGTKSGC